MMKKTLLTLFALLLALTSGAQMANPVHFTSELKMLTGDEAEIVFSATIDPGWHLYSTDLADDGPTAATFHAEKMDGAETVGSLKPRGNVKEQFDEMFGTNLRFFEGQGAFVQKIRFTKPKYDISCDLEYGACNDEMCMPPTTVEFSKKGDSPVKPAETQEAPPAAPEEPAAEPEPATETPEEAPADTTAATTIIDVPTGAVGEESPLWAPIVDELNAYDSAGSNEMNLSWWMIFLEGLLAGFLAVLTPCVWPIIPMTVSFFLKRNKDRKKAIREAIVYGLSIVVIYVLLGLLVTLLFGASALNALSTNAIFNIFFALLLIVFAASFFGAFELTLPSSWSNKIDRKVDDLQGTSHKAKSFSLKSYLSIFLKCV